MFERMVYVYVRVAHNFEDLTGMQFGRLGAVKYLGSINRKSRWLCACSCGKETVVVYQHLVNGHTQSCGCIHTEMLKARATHGMRHTPEYDTWMHLIQRCTNRKNTSWPDYGGRGIAVCDRWKKFENFFADMGSRPSGKSLDRINNNGGYEPGNCRWATSLEQNRNRRKVFGRSKRAHNQVSVV